jgi:hypothetical protein
MVLLGMVLVLMQTPPMALLFSISETRFPAFATSIFRFARQDHCSSITSIHLNFRLAVQN